jgi:hypothetical protein
MAHRRRAHQRHGKGGKLHHVRATIVRDLGGHKGLRPGGYPYGKRVRDFGGRKGLRHL